MQPRGARHEGQRTAARASTAPSSPARSRTAGRNTSTTETTCEVPTRGVYLVFKHAKSGSAAACLAVSDHAVVLHSSPPPPVRTRPTGGQGWTAGGKESPPRWAEGCSTHAQGASAPRPGSGVEPALQRGAHRGWEGRRDARAPTLCGLKCRPPEARPHRPLGGERAEGGCGRRRPAALRARKVRGHTWDPPAPPVCQATHLSSRSLSFLTLKQVQ